MKKNGGDFREIENVGYGGFRERKGGRERNCRVEKMN